MWPELPRFSSLPPWYPESACSVTCTSYSWQIISFLYFISLLQHTRSHQDNNRTDKCGRKVERTAANKGLVGRFSELYCPSCQKREWEVNVCLESTCQAFPWTTLKEPPIKVSLHESSLPGSQPSPWCVSWTTCQKVLTWKVLSNSIQCFPEAAVPFVITSLVLLREASPSGGEPSVHSTAAEPTRPHLQGQTAAR